MHATMVHRFTPTGQLAHLHITDRIDICNEFYGVDAEQAEVVLRYHGLAQTDKKSVGKELLKCIERWPRNPVFLNYLSTWYMHRGEEAKAFAILEFTVEHFPEYVFANCSMAMICLYEKRLSDVPTFLGHSLRIGDRFPEREEFHYNEVETYEKVCIRYLVAIADYKQALTRTRTLRSISMDEEFLNEFEMMLSMGVMAERFGAGKGSLEGIDDSKEEDASPRLPVKATPKVGRNDPCPCGSGKKYKKCCGA